MLLRKAWSFLLGRWHSQHRHPGTAFRLRRGGLRRCEGKGIGIMVIQPARVVDTILPTGVWAAFEQAKLANQGRVIEDINVSLSEERLDLKVRGVRSNGRSPRSSRGCVSLRNPVARECLADPALRVRSRTTAARPKALMNAIPPCALERGAVPRLGPALHHVLHDLRCRPVAFGVDDRQGEGVWTTPLGSTAATCIVFWSGGSSCHPETTAASLQTLGRNAQGPR